MFIVIYFCFNSKFLVIYFYRKTKKNTDNNNNPLNIIQKIIEILMSIGFCILIFKQKLYRHHFILISICIFFSICISITNIFGNKEEVNMARFGITILYYFFSSSREIYEKWIMDKKFVHPYLLLFFEGLIIISIGVFFSIIISFSTPYNPFINIINYISKHYGMIILLLIAQISLDITRAMTIHNFTPVHRYVADILIYLYSTISNVINRKVTRNLSFIISICCHLCILFGILIYLEVIIIHIFGMDKNTLINIDKRGEKDRNEIECLLNNDDSIEE